MKHLYIALICLLIVACGGGSSDSGGKVEPTKPGDSIPPNFIGKYTGKLNVTAEAAGIKKSDSFPITVTVTSDGRVRFDGDDPDETFTVGLSNDGSFAGNLEIKEDDCSGTVGVTGKVDGTTASGNVTGDGKCKVKGLDIDVKLKGDFSATK